MEYVAYPLERRERAERAARAQQVISATCTPPQQDFLSFVLKQYVDYGIGALSADKLGSLLETKYDSVQDGVSQLGSIPTIRSVFVDFQQHLYSS